MAADPHAEVFAEAAQGGADEIGAEGEGRQAGLAERRGENQPGEKNRERDHKHGPRHPPLDFPGQNELAGQREHDEQRHEKRRIQPHAEATHEAQRHPVGEEDHHQDAGDDQGRDQPGRSEIEGAVPNAFRLQEQEAPAEEEEMAISRTEAPAAKYQQHAKGNRQEHADDDGVVGGDAALFEINKGPVVGGEVDGEFGGAP